MQLPFRLQFRQDLSLLRRNQKRHGSRQFFLCLLITPFPGIGIISAVCCYCNDFHILKLRRNYRRTLLSIIRRNHRYNVTANQLSGQPIGKGLHANGNGLLFPVQVIKICILRCRFLRHLGTDDIVTRCHIRRCILTNHFIYISHNRLRQVVGSHLHQFHHVLCNLIPNPDVFGHPDNLCFLADRPVKHRRDCKADHQGQYNAKQADHCSVLKNVHIRLPSLYPWTIQKSAVSAATGPSDFCSRSRSKETSGSSSKN